MAEEITRAELIHLMRAMRAGALFWKHHPVSCATAQKLVDWYRKQKGWEDDTLEDEAKG